MNKTGAKQSVRSLINRPFSAGREINGRNTGLVTSGSSRFFKDKPARGFRNKRVEGNCLLTSAGKVLTTRSLFKSP